MQAWTKVLTVKVGEKQRELRDLGGRILLLSASVFCECDSVQYFQQTECDFVNMQSRLLLPNY